MHRAIVMGACLLLASPVGAADIYRCTDAGGRVEYRDAPCSRAAGQTGYVVSLPPLNFIREVDQSVARAAANALAARMAEQARRDAQQAATMPAADMAGIPLWQIPGGSPPQPAIDPKPPIVHPAPPPPSLPVNATSGAAARAAGTPAALSAVPPTSPPSLPVNPPSGAAGSSAGR